jgi:hypothetical protein
MTNELQRGLGRVEGKIDQVLERLEGQDKRINAVEKKVWYGSGIGAVLAFFAAHFLGRPS